jgi:hypothetical protein
MDQFSPYFFCMFEDENDGKMVGNLYAEGAGWDVETVKMVESEKPSDGREALCAEQWRKWLLPVSDTQQQQHIDI